MSESKQDKEMSNAVPVFIQLVPGPSGLSMESLKINKNLLELAERLKVSKYTYQQIQNVAGIYLGDGTNTAYSVYEILNNILNTFPTKQDILSIEKKLDILLQGEK